MTKSSIPDQYIVSRKTTDLDDLISALIEAEPNSTQVRTGLTGMFQVRAIGQGSAKNCDVAFSTRIQQAGGSFYVMSKTKDAQDHQLIGFVADEKTADKIMANLKALQLRANFTHVSVHAPSEPAKTPATSASTRSPAMA